MYSIRCKSLLVHVPYPKYLGQMAYLLLLLLLYFLPLAELNPSSRSNSFPAPKSRTSPATQRHQTRSRTTKLFSVAVHDSATTPELLPLAGSNTLPLVGSPPPGSRVATSPGATSSPMHPLQQVHAHSPPMPETPTQQQRPAPRPLPSFLGWTSTLREIPL